MKKFESKKKKKPSQKKIADKLEISTGFLSKILSGKRNCGFELANSISKQTGSEIYLWLTGNETYSEIRKKLLLSVVK